MSDVVRHPQPWPPMTDRPGPGEAVCRATAEEWTCTRPAGHSFDHEAGGASGRKYASWSAEVTR